MATTSSTTVSKAFRVLNLFYRHPVLTTTRCAEELDISRSTAHRLLVSLREAGAVEPTEHGHFRLSLSLFELGSLAPQRRFLGDRATAAMEELADVVGLRVHLGVRQDLHLLYLETAHGRYAQRVPTRVGNRGPLHATALGKVLLAYAPEPVINRVLASDLQGFTPHTTRSACALRTELERARCEGVAHGRQEYVLGSCSIAVPVVGPDGQARAAISIAGSTVAVYPRVSALTAKLRHTARTIERGSAWEESYDSMSRRSTFRQRQETMVRAAS
ncbi:MAG: helix-turn-helix domain-containing protein [Nitriliruptorales bacterium]|nr:helix-turn-helix domain-containing protein [Nitriliruptorales bacterium]